MIFFRYTATEEKMYLNIKKRILEELDLKIEEECLSCDQTIPKSHKGCCPNCDDYFDKED